MAGQEREGWFEREEFIGQISDMRVQNLQVEREVVQKRTFTRWMNLHLEKCDPPLQVQDLFSDIQDGHILMVLLEELSGCRLLHGFKKSSHRIFRLNNIAKVLSFLEERNVKLVSIDAADVADGNSSIILGLIWNIILFFQIKELTGNIRSQFPSSSSLSSIPTSANSDTPLCSSPSNEGQSASTAMRENSKAIKRLLQWVQRRTRKFGVAVQDFGKSWISGLAFLAVIKSIDSSLVDMRKALLRTARENLEDAFRIAHYSLGIPRLLEPEDVMINAPDEQSIMTYVSQFLEHFPGREEIEGPRQPFKRSISLCRLNLCDGDSDHVRNDGHGSRVKEMSYVFQRDFVKPPPKILISSVSEDRGTRSRPLRSPAARSWSSEDFLADSPRLEGVSSNTAKELKESANEIVISSTVYSPVQSPMGSSVTESVNIESVIGDSAISSPESWVDSEFGIMPEKFCESQSDSSLCGSLTAWDVYRAIPVEITTLDEGFVPSLEEGGPDGQPITDSYIDEGIGSLSSMESTQDRSHPGKEKVEVFRVTKASLMGHNQDMALEQESDHSAAEITEEDSEQAETSVTQKGVVPREPSSGQFDLEVNTGVPDLSELMSNTGSPPPDHLEDLMRPSSVAEGYDEEQECLMDALGVSGEVQDTEGQVNGLTDSRLERKNSDFETYSPLEETTGEVLKEKVGGAIQAQNKEVLRDYVDPKESFSSEISDALASTQPDNQGEGSMTSLNSGGTYTPNHEFPSNVLSEDLKATFWEQSGVIGSENLGNPGDQTTIRSSHGDTVDNMEISEEKQEQDDSLTGHTELDFTALTINVQCQAANTGQETKLTDQLDGQLDNPDESVSDTETASSQQIILDPVSGELISSAGTPWCEEGGVSREVDTFYTHFYQPGAREDLSGGHLEPMDLFYPDSEEPMFPEPPDSDLQSWPSVLSVSALQPALVSEALPDHPPLLVPHEEWGVDMGGVRVALKPENDQVTAQISQEADEASESQEKVWLSAEKKRGLWDDAGVPADCSDLTETEQQGSGFGSVRTDTNDSSRWDEKQNPPVLRHRWGPRSAESTDTQMVPTGPADHWRSDSWELDVLLLLWLLLYCWWLLPQLDLKTLLLNRHQ